MVVTIRWTVPASEQFAERLEWVGGYSADTAKRLRRDVDASMRHLAASSGAGQCVPEFGPGFYQEIQVGPLRIFFENRDRTLVITHVALQEETTEAGTQPAHEG